MFLQKLKCPKCGKTLGGKANKKKGKEYYYYYCRDCKLNLKESIVENHFLNFMDDIVEYDSIVNQFFLPMIIKNFDEPRENINKEIERQNARLERLKVAYLDGSFSLDDFKEKSKTIETTIKELQDKIDESDKCEYFNYTPKDILLKRDIDFISKGLMPDEYSARVPSWKKMTREEKANLIMQYVDSIEIEMIGSEYAVSNVNFRESIAKPCNELYLNGYIDKKQPCIFGNLVGELRFSEYLPMEEVGEIIMRLKNFYNVSYTEATYYVKKQVFYFNFYEDNSAIVRVFPLEDYYKKDPDCTMEEYKFGIIYIRGDEMVVIKNKEELDKMFNYIPDESNTSVLYTKDGVVPVSCKPVKVELLDK